MALNPMNTNDNVNDAFKDLQDKLNNTDATTGGDVKPIETSATFLEFMENQRKTETQRREWSEKSSAKAIFTLYSNKAEFIKDTDREKMVVDNGVYKWKEGQAPKAMAKDAKDFYNKIKDTFDITRNADSTLQNPSYTIGRENNFLDKDNKAVINGVIKSKDDMFNFLEKLYVQANSPKGQCPEEAKFTVKLETANRTDIKGVLVEEHVASGDNVTKLYKPDELKEVIATKGLKILPVSGVSDQFQIDYIAGNSPYAIQNKIATIQNDQSAKDKIIDSFKKNPLRHVTKLVLTNKAQLFKDGVAKNLYAKAPEDTLVTSDNIIRWRSVEGFTVTYDNPKRRSLKDNTAKHVTNRWSCELDYQSAPRMINPDTKSIYPNEVDELTMRSFGNVASVISLDNVKIEEVVQVFNLSAASAEAVQAGTGFVDKLVNQTAGLFGGLFSKDDPQAPEANAEVPAPEATPAPAEDKEPKKRDRR